jgi:23S rRNA pseudouridine1911/1915/1917 synthase
VAEARRSIAAGLVRVDGRRGKKGETLAAGQVVDVDAEPAQSTAPVPDRSVELVLLYVDDAFIAVDKPAGVPSHPLDPGETGTAANAIVARFPECALAARDPREGGLAHRLDRGTSGVLVAARSRDVWEKLRKILGGAGCRKTYLAEVLGLPDVTAVNAPIGRGGRRGGKSRVGGGRGLLPAHTSIIVLERREHTTLVRAEIDRGRAHQVRAHLAHIGCPILGDTLYANAQERPLPPLPAVTAPRLHAVTVELPHPVSGQKLIIEAPPPAWARQTRNP